MLAATVTAVVSFAVTDSIDAAAIGALVAGIFTLLNTYLNARILRRALGSEELLEEVRSLLLQVRTYLKQKRIAIRDPDGEIMITHEPRIDRDNPPRKGENL